MRCSVQVGEWEVGLGSGVEDGGLGDVVDEGLGM